MRAPLVALAVTLVASPAAAKELLELLRRGPVVQVEQNKSGRFGQAVTTILIEAPAEVAWQVVRDVERYKDFMPKVLDSTARRREGNKVDVRFVIEVPGPDTDYVVHYVADDAKRELRGTWQSGDLKGSRWLWKVEPVGEGRALLTQSVSITGFSSLLTRLEDEQQTITVGVNVSTSLAGVKAVKRRAEELRAAAARADAGGGGPPSPPPSH
jgi:ribosome-associated toxin RatA of RatAB toxin-antitoxin module